MEEFENARGETHTALYYHLDHIERKELGRGDVHRLENLQLLCHFCHTKKTLQEQSYAHDYLREEVADSHKKCVFCKATIDPRLMIRHIFLNCIDARAILSPTAVGRRIQEMTDTRDRLAARTSAAARAAAMITDEEDEEEEEEEDEEEEEGEENETGGNETGGGAQGQDSNCVPEGVAKFTETLKKSSSFSRWIHHCMCVGTANGSVIRTSTTPKDFYEDFKKYCTEILLSGIPIGFTTKPFYKALDAAFGKSTKNKTHKRMQLPSTRVVRQIVHKNMFASFRFTDVFPTSMIAF